MSFRLGILLLIAGAGGAFAASNVDDKTYLDFTLRTGITSGTLEQTVATDSATGGSVDYGGIPLGLYFNRDLSRGFTAYGGLHFVADITNGQVTQSGLQIGGLFHLLGGSRRTVTDTPTFQVVNREPYNLSVVLEAGYSQYSASSASGDAILKGSTLETMVGLQYRFDITQNGAVVFELLNTLVNFPASIERTQATRLELGVSYRFFL